MSAEGVNGSVGVAWNITAPPECVASVRVEFRTRPDVRQPAVSTNTTNNASQTALIQTDLQCGSFYYVNLVVTGKSLDGIRPKVSSRQVQVELPGGKVSYCKYAWEST